MIVGISGSPRPNGVTAAAVKKVLFEYGGETEYISLAGKRINGCISCLGCTRDNVCAVKDDFLPIAEAMLSADAIVFGAPDYYSGLNGLSSCLWERCFCFRHQSAFLLRDKPLVIISTGYSANEEGNPVLLAVEKFARSNKMQVLDAFAVKAYSQCYDCKFAKSCIDGNIVKDHGIVDVVTPQMFPARFEEQPESIKKCKAAGKILQAFLS
jgi:multimeric flavodoxin WrbA